MAGRQGFITNNETYVYQEAPAGGSAAFGLDSSDSGKLKFIVKTAVNAAPTGTCQIAISPAANGDITLTPNGSGKVVAAYMGIGSVISDASGALTSVTPGLAGTVLTSNGVASAPTWQAAGGGGLTWTRSTTTPYALVANNGYVQANAGAGLTTFTLPATAALGTEIDIIGESSGGWTISQGAGQSIQYGNVSTTIGVGGSLSSTNRYDTVTLKCRVADTTWSVVSAVGILSVV